MNKRFMYLMAGVGGIVGSYIPVWIWHVSTLSGWSILGSLIGGLGGIWLGYKVSQNL